MNPARRHAPASVEPQPTRVVRPPFASRAEQLRSEFLNTVDFLAMRRADLVQEGFVADYVSLHWLEWNGGSLRVTDTGRNVCQQLRAEGRALTRSVTKAG